MNGIFQKLLKKELGKAQYKKYCMTVRRAKDQKAGSEKIYQELYSQLKEVSEGALKKKRERADEAITRSFLVCQRFFSVFLSSLLTACMIELISPEQPVYAVLMGLLFAGLLLKIHEYISNRFCVTDARLMIVYQVVLEHLYNKKISEKSGHV